MLGGSLCPFSQREDYFLLSYMLGTGVVMMSVMSAHRGTLRSGVSLATSSFNCLPSVDHVKRAFTYKLLKT